MTNAILKLDLNGIEKQFKLSNEINSVVARYLKRNESKTNVDSLIGAIATVTKDINPDDRGEVKVNGQYWLAISSDNNLIETGNKVSILAIEGAKLIVKKYE